MQDGREITGFTYTGERAWWGPGQERVHINHWMFSRVAPPHDMEFALDCFWHCPPNGGPCQGRKC